MNLIHLDISSTEIRSQILNTISNRIKAYDEEINSIILKINTMQDELQELLAVDEVSLESLLLFKNDIVDASQADTTILEINNKISELEIAIKEKTEDSEEVKLKKKELLGQLVGEMNDFYRELEPSENIVYDGIFSTKSSVYSGCEETEFYLSKVIALKKVLNHSFPIIIDSFRDGELSSIKESLVIREFNKMDSQVILTATLKDEELGKYDKLSDINHLNYIDHKPYKLLSESYCNRFEEILEKISLKI